MNCIIRTGKIEDAKGILDIENFVVSEREYFIAIPEVLEETTLQKQREWIKSKLENEKATLIVAEINDEVVG